MIQDEYSKKLLAVVKQLDDLLINKGVNVYMYDTTSISRAPTAALAYLCLCKRVKEWQNLQKSEEHLKSCHFVGHPNIRLVQKCISDNKAFQESQPDFEDEHQQNRLSSLIQKQSLVEEQIKKHEEESRHKRLQEEEKHRLELQKRSKQQQEETKERELRLSKLQEEADSNARSMRSNAESILKSNEEK